jgi:hypothetical protein
VPAPELEASRRIHDDFYATLRTILDRLAERGRFLVLDVHSYNHRRRGPGAPPEPVGDNPEVNVGTGALDARRWRAVVSGFVDALGQQRADGHHLDVRENVRFRGGHVCRWVVEHYAEAACPLAVEFKKVFMDEWTGQCDDDHVRQLRAALGIASGCAVELIRDGD